MSENDRRRQDSKRPRSDRIVPCDQCGKRGEQYSGQAAARPEAGARTEASAQSAAIAMT